MKNPRGSTSNKSKGVIKSLNSFCDGCFSIWSRSFFYDTSLATFCLALIPPTLKLCACEEFMNDSKQDQLVKACSNMRRFERWQQL